MKIQAEDVLPIGTRITAQGKRGTVVKVDMARDQFGLPIAVHTCKFTERYHHCTAGKSVYKPIDPPQVHRVNYSFIEIINP